MTRKRWSGWKPTHLRKWTIEGLKGEKIYVEYRNVDDEQVERLVQMIMSSLNSEKDS